MDSPDSSNWGMCVRMPETPDFVHFNAVLNKKVCFLFSMELFLNKNGCLMDFVEAVDCERMLKAFYRRCPPVICVLLKKS